MSKIAKSLMVGCLLPVLATGAISLAQPASASSTYLTCDNTSAFFMSCGLWDNGIESQFSAQRWTIFGNPYTPGNGSNTIDFSCSPGRIPITVSYLDETGTPRFESREPMCQSFSQ